MWVGHGVASCSAEEDSIRMQSPRVMNLHRNVWGISTVTSRSLKQLFSWMADFPRETRDPWPTSWEFLEKWKWPALMQSLLYRLSIKICVITAFESLNGSTRFATPLFVYTVGKRNTSNIEREKASRSESIRSKREISTIGSNNYVDTLFTNEKCRDIHSTSI